MTDSQGFSLTEVLVSLFLISGAALALLHQQWQQAQLVNQMLLYSSAMVQIDNQSERLFAQQSLTSVDKPFQLKQTTQNQGLLLELSWLSPGSTANSIHQLQRQLSVLR